jgi:hypothetical protein
MTLRWPHPVELLLRALLATAVLVWLAQAAAAELVSGLRPLLGWALDHLAADFRVLSLDFVDDRGNRALTALAQLDHVLQVGGRVIVPDGVSSLRVSSTVGIILQPLWVGAALLLAWPAISWVEALSRLMVAPPLLLLALLLDTPLAFSVRMWHTVLQAHDVPHDSPLLWWNTWLNGGGRLALGLVAGALALVLAAWCAAVIGLAVGRWRASQSG